MRTRAGGALQVTGRCGGREACGRASGSVPRAEGNEPLALCSYEYSTTLYTCISDYKKTEL